MNKKLLPLAIGAALAVGPMAAAHAAVKLFGRVEAEYSSVKINSTTQNSNTYRQYNIGDNGLMSRLGVQISEPLGNGLKAIAHIEYLVFTGSGSGPLNREQWAGLAFPFGAFMAGRNQAPMKTFGGAAYDIFVATALQARGSGAAMWSPADGFGAGGFVDHSLKYVSPNWNGFQFAALVMASNAAQSAPNTTSVSTMASSPDSGGQGGSPDWNVAAKYDFMGGIGQVIAGYSYDKASDAERKLLTYNGRSLDNEKVWRLGGKVHLAAFTVLGQYEHIDHALGSAGCGGGPSTAAGGNPSNALGGTAQCNTAIYPAGNGRIWFLSGQYKIGNTVLVLQGGQTRADGFNGLPDLTSSNVTAGAVYFFSKRTRVYGGYQKVRVDAYNNFATGSTVGGAIINPDRAVWDIGIRHDF